MSPQESNNSKKIIAVVLCAGEGKRIKEISADLPKPLICLKPENIPILELLLNKLTRLGIERIIVAKGYNGDKIEDFIDNYIRNYNLKANYIKSINAKLYKMGPLFTFLSSLTSESIQDDELLLVIPGDTVFEYKLLTIILSELRETIKIYPDSPIILYRKRSVKQLRQRYKNSLESVPIFISVAEINQLGSKRSLKTIKKRNLKMLNEDDIIKQIIPIFLINSKFMHFIANFPNL